MPLTTGSRLGPYEIVALLGAGGMGEVYRAWDTKLGRVVAVKVLPDAFTADPERVPRFEREAKVLASLNHSNIASLFGMDQEGERHFLVMELVEGETLAERLQRRRMPIDETLGIALQIADALESAHEQGIVHRDLKPANIKITPDEKVKVLDFGLAKAMETAPAAAHLANSPTLSMMASQAGVILGTAAYMSPEQAKGVPADQRSDIFSFGIVLYEMITGRLPFAGETAPEVMANVLVRDAEFSSFPPDLNPRFRELVARCLQKQPKKRWQAIGDVRAELESIAAAPHLNPSTTAVPVASPPLWKRVATLLTVIVTAVATGVIAWRLKPERQPSLIRFPITLESALPSSNARQQLAISPDGSRIVYSARTGALTNALLVRSLDDEQSRQIPGVPTVGVISNPVFSPDGQWIAFWTNEDSTIKRVAVTGGAAITLCKAANPWGMSWTGDSIVFAQPGVGVFRVTENGGEPEVIARVDPAEVPYGPQLIDGGRSVLFSIASGQESSRWDQARIVMQSLGGTDRTTVVKGGSDARYLPTGHLVYAVRNTVIAAPFDPARRALVGGSVPVVEGVARAAAGSTGTGVAHFAVADTGTLVYLRGSSAADAGQLVPATLDGDGTLHPWPLPPRNYSSPRVSPNGRRLALVVDDGKENQIWIYDVGTAAPPRRLTFGGSNTSPVWTPDGRALTFQSTREGDRSVFQQIADGSAEAARLTRAEKDAAHLPEAWSPDGKTLVYRVNVAGSTTLWMMPATGDRTPKLFAPVSPGKGHLTAAFSPDGRWLAYGSNEESTSGLNVFIRRFPPTITQYQVTTSATSTPVWSPDGKRLYASFSDRISAVQIRTEPEFAVLATVEFRSEGTLASSQGIRNYDVAPDGKLVVIASPSTLENNTTRSPAMQISVVVNWFNELTAKVPVK